MRFMLYSTALYCNMLFSSLELDETSGLVALLSNQYLQVLNTKAPSEAYSHISPEGFLATRGVTAVLSHANVQGLISQDVYLKKV